MNFNFESIEEVKKEAIAFRRAYPVKVVGEEGLGWCPDKEFLMNWQHCYSVNNGVLAYVDGDTVYVIPVISNVKEVLVYSDDDLKKIQEICSLPENNFYVPLSNGEVLENCELRDHWNFLRAVQHEYLER